MRAGCPVGLAGGSIREEAGVFDLLGLVAHPRKERGMDGASLVWFGIGGGAAVFSISLLYQRYVKKTAQSVQSRGSFTLFAILMMLFAAGAILAGVAASSA
jgi:hypothetical protein